MRHSGTDPPGEVTSIRGSTTLPCLTSGPFLSLAPWKARFQLQKPPLTPRVPKRFLSEVDGENGENGQARRAALAVITKRSSRQGTVSIKMTRKRTRQPPSFHATLPPRKAGWRSIRRARKSVVPLARQIGDASPTSHRVCHGCAEASTRSPARAECPSSATSSTSTATARSRAWSRWPASMAPSQGHVGRHPTPIPIGSGQRICDDAGSTKISAGLAVLSQSLAGRVCSLPFTDPLWQRRAAP